MSRVGSMPSYLVWSSTGAVGAFLRTDSIPFLAPGLRLVALRDRDGLAVAGLEAEAVLAPAVGVELKLARHR